MSNEENLYCRLCATQKPNDKLINLEEDEHKRLEIVSKLNRINASNLDFYADDILPKSVCYVCMNLLQNSFDFVVAVEQAQCILTDMIIKNIKQETSLGIDSGSENDELQCDSIDHDVIVKVEQQGANKISADQIYSKRKTKHKSKHQRLSVIHEIHTGYLDAIPLSQLKKLTWKDYNWTCSYCGTQFSNVTELKNHSMQYHSACNAYRCADCNIRKLKLDSFMIHVKRYRKYLRQSCYICMKKFPNTRASNLHKSSHFNSPYICPGCNTMFSTAVELQKHKDTFYKGKNTRLLPDIDIPTDLTCLLCKKHFKTKGSLTTHMITHTDRKRTHTCDKCGKGFFSKPALQNHLILHDEARPFQCVICKYSFKTKVQLRSHVGIHGGEKPFSCDQCGRCFRLQKQLTSHSIIHTDSLPHVCTFCNKSFRFKTILNQHVRQHTGIKPYSCTICQRDFTNWPNYNKHMKRSHGMDMAKKKHTPEGVFPINPSTGKIIIHPDNNISDEWKKEILARKKPGRPKVTLGEGFDLKSETLNNNNTTNEGSTQSETALTL